MAEPLLKIHQLQAGYHGQVCTPPISLEIPYGEKVGVVGSNGAGKSTLLKTLMGLLPPVKGKYEWASGVRFSCAAQNGDIDSLFPFTVQDVLAMGSRPNFWRGLKSHGPKDKTLEILSSLEMSGLENQLFRELSGGLKQRTLLGRALYSEPQVLILDEPFSSLDHRFRPLIWKELLAWLQKRNATLIWIDHELDQVINEASYLLLLGGEKVFAGPTQEILTEEIFKQAYHVPLHLHRENGRYQIHFI